MGFETLLGNDRLKENLTVSLGKGRVSHFYLISGPAGAGKRTLARLLAAAILCKGRDKPCGVCGPCRKTLKNEHPDFITLTDPEHKNIAVRLVRDMRDDVFIRPNESDYKIYLIAQDLGLEGQNALLKILEEPPGYGVFILLTDNPEKLLPTVRSRCTELALTAVPEKQLRHYLTLNYPKASAEDIAAAVQRSGGWLGQARQMLEDGETVPQQTVDFVRSYAAGDTMGLVNTLVPMEKWKRDQLVEILNAWLELLEGALACRAGLSVPTPLARQLSRARSAPELMNALTAVRKAVLYAQGNVSPAAIVGWLSWELR
ncbi:MAG: DNA polymerase III subunit [Oscillospiraceae bacterium]|nr:DNA polymerase III subunit [Oscillospiraceae bacterium]